jgi:hypothetical protein
VKYDIGFRSVCNNNNSQKKKKRKKKLYDPEDLGGPQD